MIILVLGTISAFGQSGKATIIVRDAVSKKGVPNANLMLTRQGMELMSEHADSTGRITFQILSPGRYMCTATSVNYETDTQEMLIITGKTTVIVFELQEKVIELETVNVQSSHTNVTEPGEISLPIEKVMRMPANFFDPVRMLTSYPGVVATNDQANNITVKGNSPSGLLWRLNGMDIVNPNHLANAGTFNDKPAANGGGVNILSAQMLDRTNFYSGNMPARYGNLTSAALDMTLRNGNATRREYTAQASLLGLDFAAEGPMGKKGRTTYLANARYSTVGLLSQIGVKFGDEKINFQDFSFNINTLIGQRGGSISFFGLGGYSSNKFYAKEESEWKVDKDRFTILYNNNTYAVGTRLDLPLKKAFTFSSGVTFSSNDQKRTSKSMPSLAPLLSSREAKYTTQRRLVSGFASVTGKWSPKISSEFGVMVNYSQDSLDYLDATPQSSVTTFSGANYYALFQPYAQVSFRAGRVSTTIGARYMYSTFRKNSFDPRINIQYQLTPTSNLYVTGGQISQMLPAAIYLPSNYHDFLRKKFVEIGHMIQLQNWKLNSSVYYHYYGDVPVSPTDNFSVLNYIEGAVTNSLQPIGTGTNKGVALQAERSFVDGYYILAGASVYRSVYTDIDKIERPTKFDGRYSLMVTGGREWTKQRDGHNSSFGIHGRMMYMGGLRDTPINESLSVATGLTAYTQDANSIMLKDYMRFDLRLSWRKDKVKYTRTIALDVQNIAGIKNQAYRYYDAFQGKVVMQYQVGFIPVLVYRIDF